MGRGCLTLTLRFLDEKLGKEKINPAASWDLGLGTWPLPPQFPPQLTLVLRSLGKVGVGTLSKGLLLYLDNLIYCSMWQN